jgi:molybdopterin-guanine dinucleotide biosynthesis protein A
MRDAFSEVIILGPSSSDSFRSLGDEFTKSGPLAGIHSGLRHSKTEWNFFLAVDMPLVPTTLLQFIASKCGPGYLAVVPEAAAPDLDVTDLEPRSATNGGIRPLQPVCAAYHRGSLPVVERALSNRELSIQRLLEQSAQGMMGTQPNAIRVIEQHELTSAGFTSEMLMNVNTPADLERAKGLAERFHVN